MLTGLLPYYDVNPAKLEQLIAEGKCRAPRVVNKDIPRDLNNLVLRAMAKDVENRFLSCRDLAEALHFFLGTVPEKRELNEMKDRIRARVTTPSARCWNCNLPMPRYTKICPKCNQAQ